MIKCLLCIVVFLLLLVCLALCIFVVGGVAYVYTCGFLFDRVKFCFGFVC